ELVTSRNVDIQLVSNQPVDPTVINVLSSQSTSDTRSPRRSGRQSARTLLKASRLREEEFATFTRALNFSNCGHESRFALEERVLTTIAGWTDNDARVDVDHLLRYVRSAMLPERKGELITRLLQRSDIDLPLL